MKRSSLSQTIRKLKNSESESSFAKIQVRDDRFFFGDCNQYEIKIAKSKDLKEKAYKLIYEVYLDKKFISPNEKKMWCTKHDLKESTTTLVVLDKDEVVGSLTVVFDENKDLAAYSLFSEEIDQILSNREGRCAEIISLGIKAGVRGGEEILIKLFNFSYLISYKICHMTEFLITVNPRHVSFYKKKLKFNLYGTIKFYDKVGGAPANLLYLNLEKGSSYIAERQNNDALKRTLYKGFLTAVEESEVLSKLERHFFDKNDRDLCANSNIILFSEKMIAMSF